MLWILYIYIWILWILWIPLPHCRRRHWQRTMPYVFPRWRCICITEARITAAISRIHELLVNGSAAFTLQLQSHLQGLSRFSKLQAYGHCVASCNWFLSPYLGSRPYDIRSVFFDFQTRCPYIKTVGELWVPLTPKQGHPWNSRWHIQRVISSHTRTHNGATHNQFS